MALDSLGAPKGEDDADAGGEKVLILISSLLACDATPKKLVEVRDPQDIAAEEAAKHAAKQARITAVLAQLRQERAASAQEV